MRESSDCIGSPPVGEVTSPFGSPELVSDGVSVPSGEEGRVSSVVRSLGVSAYVSACYPVGIAAVGDVIVLFV